MSADADVVEGAVRKCFRRVVPWCVLFYVLSYVVRINIGFAALSMNKDLGLTFAMFGFANTALFLMFSACEVPSNMMLARLGARRWLPRLMIAWGCASILTIFAVGPYSLYALRALVGVAEAGLMPGILFYLGSWFPQAHRARANGLYLAALPLALTIGGPLSGAILEMNGWLGLEGWRWLFILEGLPSIAVGIIAFSLLPNTPAEVAWLTPEEKSALRERLERERVPAAGTEHHSIWKEVFNPRVVVLAVAFFCVMATINSLGVWTPQIVNELVGKGSRPLVIGFLVAIPSLIAIFVMQIVSRHSDRKRERFWHLILSMATVVLGWLVVALVPVPAVKMVGLSLSFCGTYSAMAVFWATVTQVISRRSQAVGIAFISSVATIATIVTPAVIGILRDSTHDFYAGIWFLTAMMLMGIVIIAGLAKFAQGAMKAA